TSAESGGDGHSAEALVLAAAAGDMDLVRQLAAGGAPVNAVGSSGWTPLMAAVGGGHAETTAALLDELQANVNWAGADGTTPLHVAAAGNDPELVRLLLEREAYAEQKDEKGLTAIDVAKELGHED